MAQKRPFIVCACAIALALPDMPAVDAQDNNESAPEIRTDIPFLPVGWKWELEPDLLRENWRESTHARLLPSGVLTVIRTASDQTLVQHVRDSGFDLKGAEAPQYAIYLLHEDGARARQLGMGGMGRNDLWNYTYTYEIDEQTHGPINRIGLAVLDYEGRKEAAAAGMKRAADIGAQVLPLPVIGEPYHFELTTLDGETITSEQLKGKVVLIDCWATWCGPCMAKMPELKELEAKYRDQGLVVIGINFDDELDVAKQAVEEHGLAWHEVHSRSAAQGEDELWEQVTGITSLPRLFLINRDGVLVDDFYPFEMEDRIKPLITGEEPATDDDDNRDG